MNSLPEDVLVHLFGFFRSHSLCLVNLKWNALVHLVHVGQREPPAGMSANEWPGHSEWPGLLTPKDPFLELLRPERVITVAVFLAKASAQPTVALLQRLQQCPRLTAMTVVEDAEFSVSKAVL
eukprot:RCo049856